MAGNIYGLDLGTYEIRIYDKKREPDTAGEEYGRIERQKVYFRRRG